MACLINFVRRITINYLYSLCYWNFKMVIDKSNMKQILTDFPKQCREALALAKGIKAADFNKIVVCGMGGSAIGGSILKAFLAEAGLPVYVIRDYDISENIDKKTLVFAISYSGNTEETLSALTKAKNKGAKTIAITSGGKLIDLADTIIKVPAGLQPRNAIAYLFFPIIGVLYNSGIVDVKNKDLNEMIKIISDTEYFDEKGRELAKKIKDKTPVIYSSARMEPCAYRFKSEINENAKHPAFHNVFPELCHNELEGYSSMERSGFIVIMIRDSGDHERIKKKMDICKSLFEHTVDVEEITTMGNSLLARMFSAIYIGDWTSYHLALWKRQDPTPVHIIENLKKSLKE
ncbi:bifunctional phosphoglucose/phosphomannose isomerase [Candidatus Woesearchaeota archaeon]|nr:bifunctional phosphoglucose/phosphomannose isomerase [Candidatus Woesearchaeota archaeon]